MDLFGWSVSADLFYGDNKWLSAMNLPDLYDEDFEPNTDFWLKIFDVVKNVIGSIEFKKIIGACYHLSHRGAELLKNLDLIPEYKVALSEYKWDIPFELGMHSSHADIEILVSDGFIKAFKKDIATAELLGVKNLVEHAPIGTKNVTSKAVEVLTTEPALSLILNSDLNFCWENKACYQWKPRFYGSIKAMVEFREELKIKLNEIGYPQLMDRHLYTFDTGHLLIWRGTQDNIDKADEEIADFLPKFAKYIKVFHIAANDGVNDLHITPFSYKYLDKPSRKGITQEKLKKNSELILEWLKICEKNKGLEERHIHIEAATMPFNVDQYIDFGKEFSKIYNH